MSGLVLSRQSFSLSNGDGTELRRDGDVPVSVNISVCLHMRKFYWTVTFRDGTETWRILWLGQVIEICCYEFSWNSAGTRKPLFVSPVLCCLDRTFEIAISAAHYVFNVFSISRGEPHQPINVYSFYKITNHQCTWTPLRVSAIVSSVGKWYLKEHRLEY